MRESDEASSKGSDAAGTASTGPEASGPRRDLTGYWRANVRLIIALLIVWSLVSHFAGIIFIEPLNRFRIGDLPLGFWFAQQGSIYVFVLLILVYAWRMERLDRKFGVGEERRRKR